MKEHEGAHHMPGAGLTFEFLMARAKEMGGLTAPAVHVVAPETMERLRREIPEATSLQMSFGTIDVYAKPGQKAQAWMISDRKILRAYLDGTITESQLEEMAKASPNPPLATS